LMARILIFTSTQDCHRHFFFQIHMYRFA